MAEGVYETMFTYLEVVNFLQNSWGMRNVEQRLKSDRKHLVDEIAQLFHEKVPFQNVTVMAALGNGNRQQPSIDDKKSRFMKGIGGLCYDFAPLIYGLFKALGFQARLLRAMATVTMSVPNNHMVVIITGLVKPNDVYLVDCSTGCPTFQAISLDFAKESPVYKESFLEYKYVRHEGSIFRMHGKGDIYPRNDPPIEGVDFFLGSWRRFCLFDSDLKLDKPVGELDKPAELAEKGYHIVESGKSNLAKFPRAIWFPQRRAVAVSRSKLILENDFGELVTTVLENDKEILKAYAEHFPQLGEDLVQSALKEWHRQVNK